MNIEDNNNKVNSLAKCFLGINILFSIFLVIFCAFLAINKNEQTKMASKIVEIAQKSNVEVEAKTNVLFGVWTRIKLVK